MKKSFLLSLLFLFSFSSLFSQLIPNTENNSIWFKNANSFPKRFLYSQAILWPSSFAGHVGLYIAKDNFDWSNAVRWSMYKKTFSQAPIIDEDHWSWNYEVHPYMGSVSYLAYRNREASVWESIAGTALNSIIYEFLIAGGTQTPSLNDLIVTPLGGSLLGEAIFQFKKILLKDRYLSLFEKILITILDPVEVLYYGFNYQKLTQFSIK